MSPCGINKCSRNSRSSEGCEPGVSAFLRGILKSLGDFFKLPIPFLVTSHLLRCENPRCGQSLLAVQNVFSPSSIFGGKNETLEIVALKQWSSSLAAHSTKPGSF